MELPTEKDPEVSRDGKIKLAEFENEGKLNVEKELLLGHMAENIRRGLPQVQPCALIDKHASILAGGPSAADTLDILRGEMYCGSTLVCVNNSAKFAIDNDIIVLDGGDPYVHILIDGRPFMADFIHNANPNDCIYLVASQCHPLVFDSLLSQGCDVRIFHCDFDGKDDKNRDARMLERYYLGPLGSNWLFIEGGITVSLRSIMLMRLLGYQYFHIHGLDSCWLNGKHHAYPQPQNKEGFTTVRVADQMFECSAWMVQQLEDFVNLYKMRGDLFKFQIHGPGMIAHFLETLADPEVIEEITQQE